MARKHSQGDLRASAAERRLKAFELRKAGLSYKQIGDALGVSESMACKDVHKILRDLAEKTEGHAREYRQLELERVDALMAPLWPRARGRRVTNPDTGVVEDIPPDLKAMDRLMRLMERRAKLLGLDLQPDEKDDTEVVIRVVYGEDK